MKLKDLYSLIIKIFGFFIVKDILTTLPYLISTILYFINDETVNYGIWPLLISIVIMSLYLSFAYFLIFRTDSIVVALKLEPELVEDPLTFNVSTKVILNTALIIISGFILVDEFPNFCKYLYHFYQESQIKFSAEKPQVSNLVFSAAKIVIAFLIIGERKQIIRFIRKDEDVEIEE